MSDKQTVWVVVGCFNYERCDVVSVHASEATADAVVMARQAKRSDPKMANAGDYDHFYSEEYEVQTP